MKVIVALDVLFFIQKKILARLTPPVKTKCEFSGDAETGGG